MIECIGLDPWSGVSILCWLSQFQILLAALVAFAAAVVAYFGVKLNTKLERERDERRYFEQQLSELLIYNEYLPRVLGPLQGLAEHLARCSDEQTLAMLRAGSGMEIPIPPELAQFPRGSHLLPPSVRGVVSAMISQARVWNNTVTHTRNGVSDEGFYSIMASHRVSVPVTAVDGETFSKLILSAINEAHRRCTY